MFLTESLLSSSSCWGNRNHTLWYVVKRIPFPELENQDVCMLSRRELTNEIYLWPASQIAMKEKNWTTCSSGTAWQLTKEVHWEGLNILKKTDICFHLQVHWVGMTNLFCYFYVAWSLTISVTPVWYFPFLPCSMNICQ